MGDGPPDHPLVFHSLDVAACAKIYLDYHPELSRQLALWLDLDRDAATQVMCFLLAVHDIGKFAENFQNKAPAVVQSRFAQPLASLNSLMRHDEAGALFFAWVAETRQLPGRMQAWPDDVWNALLAASFGHHGTPPPPGQWGTGAALTRLRSAMSERSRNVALGFFTWCAERFLPAELLECHEDRAKLASWWLAGLAVLADWIGSNTTWFPYAEPSRRALSLDDYWEKVAIPQARTALSEAGVLVQRPRSYAGPEHLFPSLVGSALRPAQLLAADIAIHDEPQVFFLEDATGSGKTEAALILAARLMDVGLADGLFFGLPTQATADQMFDRVSGNLPRWFDDPSKVTLVLAHGARDQSHAFREKLDHVNDAIPGEADTASLRVTQWLAQSNKRALQAQVGVGTLDQALMSGLRVKHQSLRILGLFRKVLLVDEVHSYDPYMTQVLLHTLRLHAAAGGSAILLSATMPVALRSRLLDAYAQGLALWKQAPSSGRRRAAVPQVQAQSLAYPLLTRWAPSLGAQPQEHVFPAAAHSQRTLDIQYLCHEDEVLDCIERWHAEGQSVVWVRNTVGDARAAWENLSQRFEAGRCTLFHSRFANVDRAAVQNEVLSALGKNSDAAARRGRVIITTQVFQESLDADTDQMVCDLCPVDVMLQRFGRYRRHLRDAHGNRLPADAPAIDGRPCAPVIVFGPDRDTEPDTNWYARFSRGAAKVYGAHGRVYRSARAIGQRIDLPAQFRSLVEAVYGDAGEPIPAALQTADDRALGEGIAQGALADMNIIGLRDGYGGGQWTNDERIGTRLGDSIEATLVRVAGDVLEPWARGRCAPGDDEWALSAIRVPGWWLRGEGEPVCAEAHLADQVQLLKSRHPALKYRVVLPLTESDNGGWVCTLAGQPPLRLMYCDRTGLERNR